jgi:hypothetical protein
LTTESQGYAIGMLEPGRFPSPSQPLTPNDSCWRKGGSLAYHESAAKKAYEDVTAFLKDVFEQK